MKRRIVLSAATGAVFAGVLYPSAELATRVIAMAVAFFLLLGILFCTMLIGSQDEARKREDRDQPPTAGQNKREGI